MASGCRLETKFTRVAGTAPMSTWKHIIDSHHGNKMGPWQTLTHNIRLVSAPNQSQHGSLKCWRIEVWE